MVLPGKGMGWKEFFKALKNEWTRDKVSDTAGALTFFGVLALFPFLLFLVSLASVIIDPAQAADADPAAVPGGSQGGGDHPE